MVPKRIVLQPIHEKILDLARAYAFGKTIERFLDIGCGDGSISILVKEALEAEEVYGIEIVEKDVLEAKDKGINCICLDVNKFSFPFEDDFFDFILAGNIIEHLFNTDQFLSEIYRILEPEGYLVLTTDNLASWHSRLHLLMGYQPYPLTISSALSKRSLGSFLHPIRSKGHSYLDPSGRGGVGHVKLFTSKALLELLRLHGFEIKMMKGSASIPLFHMPLPFRMAVQPCEQFFTKIPSFASYIVIEATKPKKGYLLSHRN